MFKDLLNYDPESGDFTWIKKTTKFSNIKPGSIAGRIDTHGYRQITINGRAYLAHRLAWFFVNGQFPALQIDHINGVRTDNRIANLRLATIYQNRLNRKIRCDNTSGAKGVYKTGSNSWRAEINFDNKRRYLGAYRSIDEARNAYNAEAHKLFGQFART